MELISIKEYQLYSLNDDATKLQNEWVEFSARTLTPNEFIIINIGTPRRRYPSLKMNSALAMTPAIKWIKLRSVLHQWWNKVNMTASRLGRIKFSSRNLAYLFEQEIHSQILSVIIVPVSAGAWSYWRYVASSEMLSIQQMLQQANKMHFSTFL